MNYSHSDLEVSSPSSKPSSYSPLVWFLLLDADTGEPFKNISASSVLRSSLVVSVVDQFRDVVYRKNANKLSSWDATDLLVYRNKAAFDKRSADEGREEPLDPTERIGLLGSKQDMLVVIVPSLKPFRQMRYRTMSVEEPCRIYLDAIALKLSSLYVFDYQYEGGPTIGDVLAAKDGVEDGEWSFRLARKSHHCGF